MNSRHVEGLDLGTSWLLTASLCPNGGHLAVVNYNTHPDTSKRAFWSDDRQIIQCQGCDITLIRNGAYGVSIQQNAWKIRHGCPCGEPRHGESDVCDYMIRDKR